MTFKRFLNHDSQDTSFPGGSVVKNLSAKQEMQEIRVWSLGWEDPLEEEMQPTPVFLPGESHGQRSPVSYSPWDHKKLDTTEIYILDV